MSQLFRSSFFRN